MKAERTAAATRTPAGTPDPDGLFIVWGPPSYGPRSRVFAREFGMDVSFVRSTDRRGVAVAPFKYASQAVKTALLLRRRRPGVVFVQSPPTPAVMVALLYGRFTGARVVVDAHSDAMLSPHWTRPRWLYRRIARRVLGTIVTNERFASEIRAAGGRSLVIRDVPTRFSFDGPFPVDGSFNVMVVNSFAPDEPLREVIDAARDLESVSFYVTGRHGSREARLVREAPANVRFTGFLENERYYALMSSVDAVLCLTTRNHTMQRGACEALWMGRPILTSDWPLLRDYFDRGAVHVANSAAAIRDGIEALRRDRAHFEAGIERLRDERRREWDRAEESLRALLERSGLSVKGVPTR